MQKRNFTCDGMKEKQCFGEICEQTEYSGFNWKDEMTDRGIIFSMMDSCIGVGIVFLFLGLLMGSVPVLLLAVLLMVVLPLIKDAISIFKG